MLNEYIDNFLDYLEYERKYSFHTVENYERDLTKYKNYIEKEKINFKSMDYSKVADYTIYLKTSGYSPSSINRHLSSIRTFYTYLLNTNKVQNNPFKLIKGPKKEKKLPNYLKYDEFLDIIRVCDSSDLGVRNLLILELLFATGIRVSELVNIKLNDINLNEREIKIFGKGGKSRIVYFNKVCHKVMIDYLNNHRLILLKNKKHDYLIVNHLGNKLTRRGVEDILDKIIKKSSLKHKISPHTLRHTFATLLLNEGMDIREVQELLGHKNLSTTSIYTHVTNQELRKVFLKYHPRDKFKS